MDIAVVDSSTAKPSIKKHRLLETYFKDVVPDTHLWRRNKDVGYCTLPRAMPLIMEIIDSLTKRSPASKVYLTLWSKTEEKTARGTEMLIRISNIDQFAFESGFFSNRNVTTFNGRIKLLEELGFIKTATSSEKFFGKYEYVLIMHPDVVIKELMRSVEHRDNKDFKALCKMYQNRMVEVGAYKKYRPAKDVARIANDQEVKSQEN